MSELEKLPKWIRDLHPDIPNAPKPSLGRFQIHSIAISSGPLNGGMDYGAVMVVEDVTRPGHTCNVTNSVFVDGDRVRHAPALVKHVVRGMLRDLLLHELDEWLSFDGERFEDPHEGDVT